MVFTDAKLRGDFVHGNGPDTILHKQVSGFFQDPFLVFCLFFVFHFLRFRLGGQNYGNFFRYQSFQSIFLDLFHKSGKKALPSRGF